MLSSSLLLPVCLLFLQPIEASARDAAARERRGVADYIRAGLGVTTTTTATYLETTTAGQPAPTSSNATTEDLVELATCAASWSSYDILATSNVGGDYITYKTATLVNTTVVYGTGDVYTSYGKIPVASGEFTPTRTVTRMFNVTTKTSSYRSTTSNPALITETPACSFTPKDCSRLYVSYISSLGLPSNASVPKITPSPENSPQCPDYYYKPYSSTFASTDLSVTADCKLYGNSVELLYFPSRTAGEPEPTTPVTYEYKPGTTFTSPSIYLSFDYISATRYIPISVASFSVSCGLNGCVTAGVGGGDYVSNEGSVISGQILTMAPSDVSSIVLNYGSAKASGVVSTIAENLPGYGDVSPDIHVGAVISKSLIAERLRIEDLVHPPPRAYYLRPEGAPGCGSLVHSPECGTIFEGAYRAIISLPSEVNLLQGAWATCNPAIYGVYDPPIALTERASAAKPTLPAGYQTSAADSIAKPYTITPALATPAATALRDTLPSATAMQSEPAPTDNSENGGQPKASTNGQGQSGGQSGDSPDEQDQDGGQGQASSNGQGQSNDQSGASSSGQGQNNDQSGASSSGQGQNNDQSGASSNGQSNGGNQNSGSSSDGTEGGGYAGSTQGGTGSGSPDESAVTLYNSDGSATATTYRGTSSHDGTASDKATTARSSGARESSDASSSTSPSSSSQSGSSTRLSSCWTFSVGAVLLAFSL